MKAIDKNRYSTSLGILLVMGLLVSAPHAPANALFEKKKALTFLDTPTVVQETILKTASWGVAGKVGTTKRKGQVLYTVEVSGSDGRLAVMTVVDTGKLVQFQFKNAGPKLIEWAQVPAAARKSLQMYSDRNKLDRLYRETKDGTTSYIGKLELPRFEFLRVRVHEDGRLIELQTGYDYARKILTEINRDL